MKDRAIQRAQSLCMFVKSLSSAASLWPGQIPPWPIGVTRDNKACSQAEQEITCPLSLLSGPYVCLNRATSFHWIERKNGFLPLSIHISLTYSIIHHRWGQEGVSEHPTYCFLFVLYFLKPLMMVFEWHWVDTVDGLLYGWVWKCLGPQIRVWWTCD